MSRTTARLAVSVLIASYGLPGRAAEFASAWEQVPDRVWVGAAYWANPMEDWQVRDGRLECRSGGGNRNVALLTAEVADAATPFLMSVTLEAEAGEAAGFAGFRIGLRDEIPDYRAAALRGRGIDCGVTAEGRLFFGKPPPGQAAVGIDRAGWKIHHADTAQGGEMAPEAALDGDPSTIWHTRFGQPGYPHEFQVDLGVDVDVRGFAVLPRQDAAIGRSKDWAFYVSRDGLAWGEPAARGAFADRPELQRADCNPTRGRYVRLELLSDYLDRPAAAMAEFYVLDGEDDTRGRGAPVEVALPSGPWRLELESTPAGNGTVDLALRLRDPATGGVWREHVKRGTPQGAVTGLVALVNGTTARNPGARVTFADWRLDGPAVTARPERAFGPILWAMYTLSDSRGPEGHVLKITAQMPPIDDPAHPPVLLQTREGTAWTTLGRAAIDPDARTATFRIPRWPAAGDVPYRLVYAVASRDGSRQEHVYSGTIRRDPADRPLVVAAFTGNTDYLFPNREIVRNVAFHDPDLLFFSGDQIYEHVGGYGILRTPADRSILNYLRKWYLLGWSFGEVMRDRATICIPDDHDVYQGNIWGEGGRDCGGMAGHDEGGYAQPPQMVNAVHTTQTAHLPDPYDPAPIDRGISVYYCDMVYGRVSFAILADRMFKSGPRGKVNTGSGRPDWVTDPAVDIAALDPPGLQLLGERQLAFLDAWARDWRGADLKVALSQTIFCNLANYHGADQQYVIADLDSNGWPQSGRNRAVTALRRGLAFHVAGDQHLASLVWHGIETPRDAGWSFCVPSIAAGYPRSWRPDQEGRPYLNRPGPGLPNTGDYRDSFGHPIAVFAVGNPELRNRPGAVPTGHDKASGYGLVRINQPARTLTVECWRLDVDAAHPRPGDQFPGWPRTIHMLDNDGRMPVAFLPTLTLPDAEHPVLQVIEEATGETLYTLRLPEQPFRPKVFAAGAYTITLSDPESGRQRTLRGVDAVDPDTRVNLEIRLDENSRDWMGTLDKK